MGRLGCDLAEDLAEIKVIVEVLLYKRVKKNSKNSVGLKIVLNLSLKIPFMSEKQWMANVTLILKKAWGLQQSN